MTTSYYDWLLIDYESYLNTKSSCHIVMFYQKEFFNHYGALRKSQTITRFKQLWRHSKK